VPTLVLSELASWCGRGLPQEARLIFLDDLLVGVYRTEPPTGVDPAGCSELQARYADLSQCRRPTMRMRTVARRRPFPSGRARF
jgi:hypothetical protein